MKAGSSKTTTRASKRRKPNAGTATPTPASPGGGEPEKEHVINKAPKARVAKLSGLISLPIDILLEIFGHLKPFDLLKVARMTKEFRKFVMHKSSKSVWQAALETIPDLPPCPPDMSEPAWVNLVFDPHCHFCLKATVRVVEWMLRIRICNKCAKTNLVNVTLIDPSSSALEDVKAMHRRQILGDTLVLSRPGTVYPSKCVVRADLAEMRKKIVAFKDDQALDAFVHERRQILSNIEAFLTAISSIIEKLVALGYEEDIASIRPPHSLADHELVKKPQKLTERIWANIRGPILEFMDEMCALRLKLHKKQLVLDRKLIAVAVFRGYMATQYPYTDVMPSGLDFCGFPPVKKVLYQPIEVVVDETSFADVVPLIPDFIDQWRKNIDVHLMEVIGDGINAANGNKRSYYRKGTNWNDFDEFVGDLGDRTFVASDDSDYTDSDDNSSDGEPFSFDESTLSARLKLATTVFTCVDCMLEPAVVIELDDDYDSSNDDKTHFLRQPLFYPQVKGHRCLTRNSLMLSLVDWWPNTEEQEAVDLARKLDNTEVVWRRQWSAYPLRFDPKLGECVKVLVEKAGLNPETTTANEMDTLGLWFACLKCAYDCSEPKEKAEGRRYEMPAFTWRLALEHYLVDHRSRIESAWTKIDQEQIGDATQAFVDNPKSSHNNLEALGTIPLPLERCEPKDMTWSCIQCRDTSAEVAPTSLEAVRTHLVKKHQIDQPEENRDYYKDFAASPLRPSQRRVVVSLFGTEAQQVAIFQASFNDVLDGPNTDSDSDSDF
ncbi:hypothetical protein DXG01_005753 [Tephrocybe rancida]|nr:hypothetical protein DXG01_005753 [Tephrocybe rancida]